MIYARQRLQNFITQAPKIWPLLVATLFDNTVTPLPANATKDSPSIRSRAIRYQPSVKGCGARWTW